MAAILCLIVPIFPTIAVLPRPLRGNGAPARIIGFLCFGLILLGFILRKRKPAGYINPGVVIIVGYFLLQFLTYATGLLDPRNAVIESNKTRAALSLTVMVGVTLYVIDKVRTHRQRTFVLGFLVTGLTYACMVGLLQNFGIADLRDLLVPPGFVVTLEDPGLVDRGGALRAVGTSSHAIEFSVLAAVAVPLSFHLARYCEKSLSRQLAAIACLISFLAVPAAVSRSGVVVFGIAFLIYMFVLNVRILGNAVILGLASLLAYKIVSPASVNALWSTILGSGNDESISGRTEDYAAVSEQFHRDPWFGLGLGGYPPTEYRFLDNEWLQSIVQGGIVGLTAMILLASGGIAGMTWALRQARSAGERDMAFAVGGSFIGIMASSLTFDLFSFQQATFVFFILFGLLWSVQPASPTRLPHNATDRPYR